MPTYQYACTECDHFFEQFQSFTDDALSECPTCSGRVRKVFNAVGVVFKGSGFYRNDSRSTTTSSEKVSEKKSDAGGSSEKSSTTEKASTPSANGSASSSSRTKAAS